jgi:hypothetical protein
LYGCETLREELRLRVLENTVLRRIFGPKREELAGGWRRLRIEELHNLYASQNIIRAIKSRRMRWASTSSTHGNMRNSYERLVGKPEGKKSLGKTGRKLEDNISMNLREIWWEGVD